MRFSSFRESMPLDALKRLNEACDRFEAAWNAGGRPRIEDYVAGVPDAERKALLRELLYLDLHYAPGRKISISWNEYVERFPEHRGLIEEMLVEVGPTPLSGGPPNAVRPSAPGVETVSDDSKSTPAKDVALSPPGYEILGTLGRGGMGVVYKARHVKLNRLVALKMILAGSHAEPAALARFQTEGEAVARFQHPNIVQIYEIGETGGLPFFSLEYVAGGTLAQRIDGTPQPAKESAALVETLARAMHAAHGKGIIHRDLKPANVLLQIEESRLQNGNASRESAIPILQSAIPKITDFGLAKRLEGEAGQTRTGAVIGTPSYMAPEQAEGRSSAIGPLVDVYALGAILYELLTGRPPFKGPTAFDTLRQVITTEPVQPRQLQPTVPADLETICLKSLEKEPGRRYKSAQELAEDLWRFQAREPIAARAIGTLGRLWRWSQRKPTLALASFTAMLAGLIALGTFVVAFFLIRDSRDEAIEIAAEKERQRIKAQGLATENGILAANAIKDKLDIDERRKKAETLLVKLKFEDCLRQSEGNRTLGMLTAAALVREAMMLEDLSVQDSLRLHLASWYLESHRLVRTFAHKNLVHAVASSPDGKIVLTGSADKTARLWESATGKPLGTPLIHHGDVRSVAFSLDGNVVLTGSDDNTARLWESRTGQPLGPPLQHQGAVICTAFSWDGRTVVTGSADKTARLWDTATGQPLGPALQHQGPVRAVAFSPDSKVVLTGSEDKTARLWESSTSRQLRSLLEHKGSVWAVAFSPDGKILVTGSPDKTARLWDSSTGQSAGPPLEHQGSVFSVAFSPDGKSILTSSGHVGPALGEARLWATSTGKLLVPPLQHQTQVVTAKFSPDGNRVLTASLDNTARLWDAATGKQLGLPLVHVGQVWTATFNSDGKSLMTCSYTSAWLWETATGQQFGAPMRQQYAVTCLAVSPDGKTVVTGSNEKISQLWDTTTRKPLAPPLQHHHMVLAAAFSPDGKTVLTGCEDNTAQLWETGTGKKIGSPLQHEGPVRGVAFSPDGKSALTGSFDKRAQLWETETGKPLGPPLQHQGIIWAVAFSPDGKTVLTGSRDGTAQQWEAASGKKFGPPLQHRSSVEVVAFSPDGLTILTASLDNTARLWERATGEAAGPPLQHQGLVRRVAFSPDGKLVLTGSRDGTARLWETATGKPFGPPLGHQGPVQSVAFSPDGKTVLTGSVDKTARLWETATGKPVGNPWQHPDSVGSVAFSPDGFYALTGSDRTVRFWHVPKPLAGSAERVVLGAQVATGQELNEFGAMRILDSAAWEQRRNLLDRLDERLEK